MTASNGTTNLNLDWLVSVDDHILEPPNLWSIASRRRTAIVHPT